ncbi:MAG TPA: methyltransferase domain-containing protein [Solirubrobacteraceae bacterium]
MSRDPSLALTEPPDPVEQRLRSVQFWEEAAPGWIARQELMRQFAGHVSHWLVDAIHPQPGETVLELAAGLGETGLLAAELVAPGGEAIISDQARAMIEGARTKAKELGIENVRFEIFGAEWIDLPVASVDAVLCRFGYMLVTDPLAALIETRRVLRPNGRLALAVWDHIGANPWAAEPSMELTERGLAPPPADGSSFQPGPFALGDKEFLGELLEQAGFTDVRTDALALERHHSNFGDFWDATLDMSRVFHDLVQERPEREITEIRQGVAGRLARFERKDGTLVVPGRALVALASA